MTSSRPRQIAEKEVRRHYELLRGWLIELGYDVKYLLMPPTNVLVLSVVQFADFVRAYAMRNPDGFRAGQAEEYGRVRSVEETAREAVGWCFGPYGKRGSYTIFMREDYLDPHLGAEILHIFEGQLGIRRGTLERQFVDYAKRQDLTS